MLLSNPTIHTVSHFKAALFDLDGTLLDTESLYTQFWGRVGRRYYPQLPDFAQRIKGTTLLDIRAKYFPDADKFEQVVQKLYEWESSMPYRFFPGALALMRDLRAHHVKLALVTSSNQDKLRHVKEQMPHFPHLFDRILTAEDFAASKPNPDCYFRAAETLGCQPMECVVFEDAFSGLDAGMAAGIFTFGMATSNAADAIRSRCSYVLDGFEDLDYAKICHIIGAQ